MHVTHIYVHSEGKYSFCSIRRISHLPKKEINKLNSRQKFIVKELLTLPKARNTHDTENLVHVNDIYTLCQAQLLVRQFILFTKPI